MGNISSQSLPLVTANMLEDYESDIYSATDSEDERMNDSTAAAPQKAPRASHAAAVAPRSNVKVKVEDDPALDLRGPAKPKKSRSSAQAKKKNEPLPMKFPNPPRKSAAQTQTQLADAEKKRIEKEKRLEKRALDHLAIMEPQEEELRRIIEVLSTCWKDLKRRRRDGCFIINNELSEYNQIARSPPMSFEQIVETIDPGFRKDVEGGVSNLEAERLKEKLFSAAYWEVLQVIEKAHDPLCDAIIAQKSWKQEHSFMTAEDIRQLHPREVRNLDLNGRAEDTRKVAAQLYDHVTVALSRMQTLGGWRDLHDKQGQYHAIKAQSKEEYTTSVESVLSPSPWRTQSSAESAVQLLLPAYAFLLDIPMYNLRSWFNDLKDLQRSLRQFLDDAVRVLHEESEESGPGQILYLC